MVVTHFKGTNCGLNQPRKEKIRVRSEIDAVEAVLTIKLINGMPFMGFGL